MVHVVRAEKTLDSLKCVIIPTAQTRKQRFGKVSPRPQCSLTPLMPCLRCFPFPPLSGRDAWTWRDLGFLGPLPVSKLVGNGESQRKARVFIDVTASVRLAHSWQVRQTQGLAGAVDTGTDVFPESRERRWTGGQKTPAKSLQERKKKSRYESSFNIVNKAWLK